MPSFHGCLVAKWWIELTRAAFEASRTERKQKCRDYLVGTCVYRAVLEIHRSPIHMLVPRGKRLGLSPPEHLVPSGSLCKKVSL
jgi:hypothetical protein